MQARSKRIWAFVLSYALAFSPLTPVAKAFAGDDLTVVGDASVADPGSTPDISVVDPVSDNADKSGGDSHAQPQGVSLESDNASGSDAPRGAVDAPVAQIADAGYATLAEAFAAAADGDIIKLVADGAIDATIELSDARTVTLDLCGHTLSSGQDTAFKLTDGSLTIKNDAVGNGGISVTGEAFRVIGKDGATPILTIDKGVEVVSTGDRCVYILGTSTLNTAGNLGSYGQYSTIQGNGNAENSGTTINITGGRIACTQEAIYVPQDNTMTISDGEIQGKTAVYCKSGRLTITGGILVGNGNKAEYVYDGNGCKGTGDALVVDTCGYPGGDPIVSVQGGSFRSIKANPVASYASDGHQPRAGFVTGGFFSSEPPVELMGEGFTAIPNADSAGNAYPWTVSEAVTVTFDVGDGAAEVPSQIIAKGAMATKPNDPSKDGFTFEGWFAVGSDTLFDFSAAIEGDITLTARWTDQSDSVDYDKIKCSASLSLNDSIDINFYVMDLPKETDAADYRFVYWINGDTDHCVETRLYDIQRNRIVVTGLAASQMSDVVQFEIYHNGKQVKSGEYSIRQYCESKSGSSDQKLVDLCMSTLNYGTYAQHYFGYGTDDLANKRFYPDIENVLADTTVPDTYKTVADAAPEGYASLVKKASVSASLESRVMLNLYLTPQDGVDLSSLHIAVDGYEVGEGPTEIKGGKECYGFATRERLDDGRLHVQVSGIAAKHLNHMFRFVVDPDGELDATWGISYSALSYAFSKQGKSEKNLAMLSKALYLYWLTASTYFGIPDSYSVTWTNEDGTVLQHDEAVPMGEVPVYHSDAPTKQGDDQYSYAFVGWDPEVAPVTGDTTYVAVFERVENSYTVAFDSNGAGDVETQKVTYGARATEPTVPTRDDGFFLGWFEEGSDESYDFASAVTRDVSLKAKWMTLLPSELELYPNDLGRIAVKNAVGGQYYYWKYAGNIGSGGFDSVTGEGKPYAKAPGSGTATLTVYMDSTKAERAYESDLVCNITVKDVAARVADTEYATADFAAAVEAAKASGEVLEVYTSGNRLTLGDGETLRAKAADNRGKGSVTVSAPAATAEHMYAIEKTTDDAGVMTYTCVDKGEPNVEFTAEDGTKSYSATLGLSKAGTYKVMRDFSSSRVSVAATGVTLDLNGHTVSFATGNDYPAILLGSATKKGELTITDSSESRAGAIVNDGCYAVWAARRKSSVIIEAGELVASTSAVYTSEGSTATIRGGTFKVTGEDTRYVINCKDDNKGTIAVSGGTFYAFDPSDNAADGAHTSYLAEGKAVAADEDAGVATYTVCDAVTATFVGEGGVELQKVTIAAGQTPAYTADTPAKPTDDGHIYEFSGWEPALGPISEDTTYTAQFKTTFKQFTITFDTGEGGTAIDPITQDFDSEVVAPADPTREGYVFKGWDQEIPERMPAHDMTIVATWRKVPDLSLSLEDWTYGDPASTPALEGNEGAAEVSYTYKAKGAEDDAYATEVPTQAGDYIVRATVAQTDDFCDGTATADFTIAKRGVTVRASDASSPYKAALAELGYQVTSGTLAAEGDLGTFGITPSTEATPESAVGTYDITLTGGADNANYDVSLEKGTYTITKANAYVTVHGFAGVFDGQPHAISVEVKDSQGNVFTDLLDALFGTGKEATVYYSTETELDADNYREGTTEAPTRTDVGITTVHYYVDLANYQADTAGGSDAVSGSQTIEVSQAMPEITAPAPVEDLAYTGAPQQLVTAGATTGGTMRYYAAHEPVAAGATIETIGADRFFDELPTGIDQGSYYVYYYVDGGTNYASTELGGPVEARIAPRTVAADELTIAFDADAFTYNATDQRPNVSVSVGDTPLVEGDDYAITWPDDTKSAGDKDVMVTLQGNYSGSGTASYAIAQKQVTLVWDDETLVYSGDEQGVTCQLKGIVEGDNVQLALSGDTGVNAGEYTALASLTGEAAGNYVIAAADATHAWSIEQAQNAIKDLAIAGWAYGDAPEAPSANATFGIVSYTYSDTEGGAYTSSVPTAAGTWWVKATVAGTGDYGEASATKSFEIGKRAIRVAATDQTIAYGSDIDTSDSAYAVTRASGEGAALVNGDVLTAELSTSDKQVTTDGTIEIAVTSITDASGDNDVSANYDVETVNGKLTITAKDAIPFDEDEHKAPTAVEGLTYDGSEQALVAAGNPDGGTVMYRVTKASGEEQAVVSDWSAGVPAQRDAGEYLVSYYVADNANYATCGSEEAPLGTLSVTVAQKEVGLAWSDADLFYNGSEQAPSVTATGLIEGDECTVTVAGAAIAAGAYTATAAALSNDNYRLPAENTKEFDIWPKAVPSEDVTVSFAEGKGSLVYNGKEQAPQAADIVVTDGDALLACGVDYVIDVRSKTHAGTYELAVVFLGSYAGAEHLYWTITKAPNAVSNLVLDGWTYGATANEPTADADFGDISFTYSDGDTTYAQPPAAAGEYTVTATVAGADDYESAMASTTYTIAKAPLTVTAKAKDITYGDAPDNDGVAYSGFVNNENEGVLGGELMYAYTYEQYGNVGSYAITPSGLTSDNYDIAYVDGGLTVGPKTVGIEWDETPLAYTGEPQAPRATATGLVNDDDIQVVVTGAQTEAGSGYSATATSLTGDKAGNYALPSDSLTREFSIAQASAPSADGLTDENKPGAKQDLTYTNTEQTLVIGPKELPSGYDTIEYKLGDGDWADDAPKGRAAGTYPLQYRYVDSTNNHAAFEDASFTLNGAIAQKEVSITWGDDRLTFTGEEQEIACTVDGFVEDDDVRVVLANNKATNAGEYTATATLEGASASNYVFDGDDTHFWIIEQVPNAITGLTLQGWTYGDEPNKPSATAEFGGDTMSFTYGTTADGEFADAVPTAAGAYYVKATVTGTDNYASAESEPVAFTIARRPVTVSGITASDREYDGATGAPLQLDGVVIDGRLDGDELGVSAYGSFADKDAAEGKVVTITITGLTGADAGNYVLAEEGQQSQATATITPKKISVFAKDKTKTYGDDDPNFDYDCSLSELLAGDSWAGTLAREDGEDAGSYAIDLGDLSAGANYEIAFRSATFTIDAKVVNSPTIELSNSEYTYDGTAKEPAVTVKDDETVIPEAEYVVSYENNVNAGTATVKVTDKANGNYVVNGSTTFTIGKAQASVSSAPEAMEGLTYTGEPLALAGEGTANGGEMQYSLSEDGPYGAGVPAATDAGTYHVYYKVVGDDNHSDSDVASLEASISKATLTVTANAKTIAYGDSPADAGVTYDGFLGGDTDGLVSGSVGFAYSYDQYGSVGAYEITPDVSGLSADNYRFAAQAGTLTVEPRAVTLSWAENPTYDGTQKTMAATVGGTVNGDEVTVASYEGNTATDRAQDGYTAVAKSLSSDNYRLPADASHGWNVERADNAITSLALEGWTYGESANAPVVAAAFGADTATFAYGTAADGEFADAVPTAAGTYYVKATIAGTDNYAGAEKVEQFTIAKRDITIAADDKSSAYKADIVELTYGISSGVLASGDTLESFGVQASTTATAGSPVGTYPITLAVDGDNANYNVTLVNGTYSITKADAIVTVSAYAGTYDGQAHGISIDVQDTQGTILTALLDAIAGTGKEATVYYGSVELTEDNYKTAGSEEPVTRTNAGTTTVYYYVDLANYTPSGESASVSGSQTITIEKAPLTVTAKPATITYGDAAASNGVSYDGFVNGETEGALGGELAYVYSYQAGNDAGDYAITPSGLMSDNYEITYVPGTLTVGKADAVLTTAPAAVSNLVYTGQAQDLVTAGVSSDGTLQYSDAKAGTFAETVPTGTNAGTYSVWYKVAGDANHNDTAAAGPIDVTIAKADLADLAVDIENWNFGEAAKAPSVSNNSGSGAVTYEYKAKDADDSAYATTVPTEVGEYKVRASVAETDNYNAGVATKDFKIKDASAIAFTHSDNLAHTDAYLYRVGNGNAMKLGTLFKAEDDATPNAADVKIKVNGVEANSSIHTEPLRGIEAGSTANCTYSTNASDWTQSTLKFNGEGPVGVEIWVGDGEHYTLNLEVVNGNNFVEGATLNGNANIVLLGNVKLGASSGTNSALTLNGKSLYGNGFEIDATGSNISSLAFGLISLTNSTLDNAVVHGPTYTSYTGKYGESNYAGVIVCYDNAVIANSRISGAADPVCVYGTNAQIVNTVLSGGAFANLHIRNRGGVTVSNVTTINTQNSLGIVFYGGTSDSYINIDGPLTQHNFISENASMSNSNANILKNKVFSNSYSNYHFKLNNVKYANMGIVSMDNEVGAANIRDNRDDTRNYAGMAASFSILSVSVNGYVYTIENTDSSMLETDYDEPEYSPSTQMPYPPVFTWSVPSIDNQAAGGDTHCYKDNGGKLQIQFVQGDSKTIDARAYATFTRYGSSTSMQPDSISCVRTSDDTALPVSNGLVSFSAAGEYAITYHYTDIDVYDYNLSNNTKVDYDKTIIVNVAVKKNAPNAVITSSSDNGNIVWGKAGSSYDPDYNPCIAFLDGLTITDYDMNGNPYTVLDGNNQSGFISSIASASVSGQTVTIILANGTKLTVTGPAVDGSVQLKTHNGKLYYCDSKADNNPAAFTKTFAANSYKYTGENGVEVQYGTKRSFTSTTSTNTIANYSSLGTAWTSNRFLMYNAQEGVVSPKFASASPATLPTPTREGYVFLNWNTKSDGSGTARGAGASLAYTSTTTLYAIWAQAVTVSFNSEGDIVETISGGVNTSATLPSKNDFNNWLEGWYTSENGGSRIGGAGESFTLPTGDATYYAHWSPKHVVTFNTNGGAVDSENMVYAGTALTLPTATNGAKTLEGWFTAAEGGTRIGAAGDSYIPTADVELFAQWSDNTLVTFDGNGGTAGTGSDTYDHVTPITLPDATWVGHQFNGWYTEASGGTKVGDVGDAYEPEMPVTLYAQWTAYTVSFDGNGATNPSPLSAGANGSVTLPTPTRTGYTFNGWYTEASGGTKVGNGGASYTPTADVTLHAQWSLQTFTITFVAGNGGSVSLSSIANVPYGSSVSINSNKLTINGTTVNAIADSNYTFEKWSIGSGTTITKAQTITASFKSNGGGCVPSGTMVTMADGSKKPVEDVTVDDKVLVFSHETGSFDTSGIIFTEADGIDDYRVINLEFSDGSKTRLIYEHGYFDLDLMQYVYIREDNCVDYIGHRFCKVAEDNGNRGIEAVTLTDAYVTEERTGCFSFPSVYHLNFIADGFLSMPGGITGMFNFFEYGDDLRYDEAAKARDIETYGLMSYEDFADYMTYEEYCAFPAPYLGVALGKGIMTPEYLEYLISRYVADKR